MDHTVCITGVENTAVSRRTTVRHCVIACVIVTSLQLVFICALSVSSIQRNADVEKLQQQVADLQQTVARLQQHQQQQQPQQQWQLQQQQGGRPSSLAQLLQKARRNLRQRDGLQTKHIIEVSEQLPRVIG